MGKTMKFGVLVAPRKAEVHERPIPEIKPNEVLVKMETCNICTTDYGQWLGIRPHQPFPMAGGHENSGIIVEKGSQVREDLEVGDRVAFGYEYCGECVNCRSGDTASCLRRKRAKSPDGYYGTFGFAEYKAADARSVYKMDKDLPPSQAGFLEPVATVIHGMKRLRVKPREDVVVIGAGTMGLNNAQVARAYGARVIISELLPRKIERAQLLGFEEIIDANREDPVEAVKRMTGGKGADAVILGVGATKATQQALEMVKPRKGRILFFSAGYPAPEMEIDPNTIHYKELELIGTFGGDVADFQESAKFLNTGVVNVAPLLETEFPLKEIQKAYETASTPGNYRVTVRLS